MGDININWNSPLPFVDANIQWFQERLQAGTTDGSLTTDEQRILNNELTNIQQLEARDVQGNITYQQQQQIWSQLSEMNRDVYSLRHNDLGTTLPEDPYGQPPQLIDEYNYWEHPAVNKDPDNDGDNDLAPPYAGYNPDANSPGEPANPSPWYPYPYLPFGPNPLGFGNLYNFYDYSSQQMQSQGVQPVNYSQMLSQYQNTQNQYLAQGSSLVNEYQPSSIGSILPPLMGFLGFFL